ncbi:hypothetical protein RYZ26_00950 [Terasakiella sp. A23]|uniref:hypothetical protein n=1 Tax=Terasakiella sp. FCG-A23 TaxID=3080561 RepID=UPI00295577DA|nr:hypothetical protein [Terasakiella sp. A23]MDV7338143.1 hypothetical protein [Terasakiella sp. A23]
MDYKYGLESNQTSIVLVGKFNPLIFQPRWLESVDLIGAEEALRLEIEEGALEIIHQDVAILNLNWGKLHIDRGRFMAICDMEPHEAIFDFTRSCFDILDSTPIYQMGINRTVTYRYPDENAWHHLGDTLAPKEPWGELMYREGERVGGLRTIVMEQATGDENGRKSRLDGGYGYTQIKIEAEKAGAFAVSVQVNNHFEVEKQEDVLGSSIILDILNEKWEKSVADSNETILSIQQV